MMKKLLSNYHDFEPTKVCFLDSAYVDQVFGEYEGYINSGMQCTIDEKTIKLDTNGIKINLNSKVDLMVRLRLKIYDQEQQKYSYHINLLIFDVKNRTIERFEPLRTYGLGDAINHVLKSRFEKNLPTFRYIENDFHPQKHFDDECKKMGLCVAHVIKFGVCHLLCKHNHLKDEEYDDQDIYRFCAAIVNYYH